MAWKLNENINIELWDQQQMYQHRQLVTQGHLKVNL